MSETIERLTIVGTGVAATAEDFADAVSNGLVSGPKSLDCAWFYDAAGSRLFEEICALPEYYPTRAELEILERNAAEILRDRPDGLSLIELGSGSAAKTRVLIDELLRQEGTLQYVPIDISTTMLAASSEELLEGRPGLEVHGIAMEYTDGLHEMRRSIPGPKLLLWLGSSIGNLDREQAVGFLREVRGDLDTDDRLLLGVDLRKKKGVLERAYDDAAGVTARFNENLLVRINRELGGRFDLESFEHRAVYVEDEGRIEMHLVSRRAQTVAIEGLGLELSFDAGEFIHTESSYKYSLREIDELVEASGFALGGQWLDGAGRFSVSRLVPVE